MTVKQFISIYYLKKRQIKCHKSEKELDILPRHINVPNPFNLSICFLSIFLDTKTRMLFSDLLFSHENHLLDL